MSHWDVDMHCQVSLKKGQKKGGGYILKCWIQLNQVVKSSESQLNLAFFSQKGHLRNHQSQNVHDVNRLTSTELWNDKENDYNLKPRGRSCPPPLSEKNFKKVLAPPETTQRQLCRFFSIQNTASWIVTGNSLFFFF